MGMASMGGRTFEDGCFVWLLFIHFPASANAPERHRPRLPKLSQINTDIYERLYFH
jgi:hypothetical protein